MKDETHKRMAGDYEIIQAIHIGDREIVLGEKLQSESGDKYMCAFCQQNELFAAYSEVMCSDNYAEMVKMFGERVTEQAEKTRVAMNAPKIQGIDDRPITASDCTVVSCEDDLNDKIVVIKPEVLRREYRRATCQLKLCTGGFGASPHSRGSACFCVDLYTGKFEMQDQGLAEVENPSEMLLSGRPDDAPGTCVTCVMEGVRPVLAEVQALVVTSAGGNPRRTSNGFDYNRAAMLLAVLEKRGGLKISACDAYLNIVGGLYLDEPAADLAAVIALASSYLDRPVPSDLVAIGEVGLTGELRSVNQLSQRVSEIQRLGFRKCVVPAHRANTIKVQSGLTVIPARNIGEAIRAALRPAE